MFIKILNSINILLFLFHVGFFYHKRGRRVWRKEYSLIRTSTDVNICHSKTNFTIQGPFSNTQSFSSRIADTIVKKPLDPRWKCISPLGFQWLLIQMYKALSIANNPMKFQMITCSLIWSLCAWIVGSPNMTLGMMLNLGLQTLVVLVGFIFLLTPPFSFSLLVSCWFPS